MLTKQSVPILEYDPAFDAIINPVADDTAQLADAPKGCVLSFMHETVRFMIERGLATQVTELRTTSGLIPIYQVVEDGVALLLVNCPVGAPMAAGVMEEVQAMGVTHFLSCGGAGSLDRSQHLGQILLPERALRDEGTSYHYQPPARFIQADPSMLPRIEAALKEAGMESTRVTTWTTDAFYRETREKFLLRKEEGCDCVDMECSAFMAVAKHRGLRYGAILYAADNLDGEHWDSRNWVEAPIRNTLLEVSLRCLAKALSEDEQS